MKSRRGQTPLIYLDNAATTRPCPESVAAMEKAGMEYTPAGTYELAYSGIQTLLRGLQ